MQTQADWVLLGLGIVIAAGALFFIQRCSKSSTQKITLRSMRIDERQEKLRLTGLKQDESLLAWAKANFSHPLAKYLRERQLVNQVLLQGLHASEQDYFTKAILQYALEDPESLQAKLRLEDCLERALDELDVVLQSLGQEENFLKAVSKESSQEVYSAACIVEQLVRKHEIENRIKLLRRLMQPASTV